MSEVPVSYAIGDVVSLKQDMTNTKKLITDIIMPANDYAVNGTAWFDFEELTFVSRATEKSLAQAIKITSYEEEEEDGEDSEGYEDVSEVSDEGDEDSVGNEHGYEEASEDANL